MNPKAKILSTFINSWTDVGKAKTAAVAQLDAGADVIAAITDRAAIGAIKAAQQRGAYSIGFYADLNHVAPDSVLTSIILYYTKMLADLVVTAANGELEGKVYHYTSGRRLCGHGPLWRHRQKGAPGRSGQGQENQRYDHDPEDRPAVHARRERRLQDRSQVNRQGVTPEVFDRKEIDEAGAVLRRAVGEGDPVSVSTRFQGRWRPDGLPRSCADRRPKSKGPGMTRRFTLPLYSLHGRRVYSSWTCSRSLTADHGSSFPF